MATIVDGGQQFIEQGAGRLFLAAKVHPVDELAKRAQLVELALGQFALEAGFEQGGKHRDITPAGVSAQ